MESKANYIAVGAFVLAFMFGLGATGLWLGNPGDGPAAYGRGRGQGPGRAGLFRQPSFPQASRLEVAAPREPEQPPQAWCHPPRTSPSIRWSAR